MLVRLSNMLDQSIEELLSGDGVLADSIIVQLVTERNRTWLASNSRMRLLAMGERPM
jgi:hypothetical protein